MTGDDELDNDVFGGKKQHVTTKLTQVSAKDVMSLFFTG